MNKNSLSLNDSIKNEAATVIDEIKNQKSKMRAYASLIGTNILAKYLENQGLIVDTLNCCSNNSLIISDFDVADIKANGVKMDVRVFVGDDYQQMMIPRNHLIYGLTPAIYVAVKIDNGINNAEIIGFIDSEMVDSAIGDKDFVIIDNTALKPASELIYSINASNIEPNSYSVKDHDKAKEMFVSYLDNEISNVDKEYLIRHLASCDDCRNDFNILYKLNKKFIQTSHCKEIAEMFSETLINQEFEGKKPANDSSIGDIISTGAAIASTAAAGVVIAASGSVLTNTAAGMAGEAIIDTVENTVSKSGGVLGKIKGLFSKKEKITDVVLDDISDILDEPKIEIQEIGETDEIIQDETEIFEHTTTIQDDIQNFVQEISDNVIANFDEEAINQAIEQRNIYDDSIKEDFQEFEIIEDEPSLDINEENISELETSDNLDNSDLSFEVIDEDEQQNDLNFNIPVEDNSSLEKLDSNIESPTEEDITVETSYMSNFIKPETTVETLYNSTEQEISELNYNTENYDVDKGYQEIASQDQNDTENIEDLLQDIDKVEIVGSLETIDVGEEQIDGLIDVKTNTVIKLNITKREINPFKIAAAVFIATSVSLGGYFYWKHAFLLANTSYDESLFKNNNVTSTATLPPSNNNPETPVAPAKPPESKKPVEPKPYVKKAEEVSQNNSNDDIAKALVSQSGPVKINSISWEVGASMVSNSVFKNYLMVTGQALKTALATDLTLANERAINDQIKVLVVLDLQGNVVDTKIKMSSGSNQIDKIVLQTLKNTLSYTKLPPVQTNKKQIKVGLIVNL